VTVWIGEIQWMLTHGYALRRDPILRPLDHIECRDAVLQAHYEGVVIEDSEKERDSMLVAAFEPEWPEADAIVGNPPFLGGSKKRGELGSEYFNALNRIYKDRIPGGADLVTYWFEKARAQIEAGKAQRAGLVATNSIRGGANRKVLSASRYRAHLRSCERRAWSTTARRYGFHWYVLAMRSVALDGKPVSTIHADLTRWSNVDVTRCVH
jgi:hypothetical protein